MIPSANANAPTAFVYGSPLGHGGLGVQSGSALRSLIGRREAIHAIGPGYVPAWPLDKMAENVTSHELPVRPALTAAKWPWYRWRTGALQYARDCNTGRMAAEIVAQIKPRLCYAFTQVALETLRWAKDRGVPTVLESPNGHLRSYRSILATESRELCGREYAGHPTERMVERVEAEYSLATRIRVSSEWARRSLVAGGVDAAKIVVLPQAANLSRFVPASPVTRRGPLEVCYVGTFDLRKGFVYLLRALQRLDPGQCRVRIVGGTVDRHTRRLFERESRGLDVAVAPGDPLPAYQQAELFVLPTLEDGSPFVVAEAMACGLPVIVTDQCGNADWVEPGKTGWIVPARDSYALEAALSEAIARRSDLPDMGQAARAAIERLGGTHRFDDVGKWFYQEIG